MNFRHLIKVKYLKKKLPKRRLNESFLMSPFPP